MKEKLRLWFECDFKLFSWCVLQLVLHRFTTKELAEMYARQVKLVHWEDKAEMKSALEREDMKAVQKIADKAETEDYIDSDLYMYFLRRIMFYEIVYILLGILLLFIVFNIGRR